MTDITHDELVPGGRRRLAARVERLAATEKQLARDLQAAERELAAAVAFDGLGTRAQYVIDLLRRNPKAFGRSRGQAVREAARELGESESAMLAALED